MSRALTEELVVLLDPWGQSIGTMPKARVHTDNTPLHSAFSVFLFNQKGQMLAQQRAWSKLTWPGIWSNTCCGHPGPGESHQEAAYRRLRYELGIEGVPVEMVLPRFRYSAMQSEILENEICPVLVGVLAEGDSMRLNPEEVEAVRWVSWQEFLRADPDDPESELGAFSPWSILEAKALNASGRFSEIMEAMEVEL